MRDGFVVLWFFIIKIEFVLLFISILILVIIFWFSDFRFKLFDIFLIIFWKNFFLLFMCRFFLMLMFLLGYCGKWIWDWIKMFSMFIELGGKDLNIFIFFRLFF